MGTLSPIVLNRSRGARADRFFAIKNSIILTNGNTWKVQRSAGHAAFANPINLRYFLDRILPKHLDKLFGGLDKAAEAEGHKGKVVDLQEVAYDYAMSVFGELAYDVSLLLAGYIDGTTDRGLMCPPVVEFWQDIFLVRRTLRPGGDPDARTVFQPILPDHRASLTLRSTFEKGHQGRQDVRGRARQGRKG
jgi:hypothetical protein